VFIYPWKDQGVDPLIGRDGEVEALERALAGQARVVVIEGEPGIGKSRLLAELVARAPAGAGARASEAELDLPYAVFAEALELPELDADPHRAHRALRELLAGLDVFWVDDAHWLDPASSDALAALVRRPPDGVLVALAARPAQLRRGLASAVAGGMREGTVLRIAPGPLDRDAAAALVGAEVVDAIYRDSGGNPFYLEQLARAHDGAAPVSLPGVPDRVAAALVGEFDVLSPEARRLLDAAAVLGDPFDAALATDVAELDGATAALDELAGQTLVRATDVPGRFAFRHPVVRRAAYEVVPAGSKLAAHERAAATLRARGAGSAVVAHHVAQYAQPGDETAIALLGEAADELLARAPLSSAHLRSAVLRLLPEDDAARRTAVALALADAQSAGGWPDLARAVLRSALDHTDGQERIDLGVRIGSVEYWLGEHDAARERFQVALQSLPSEPSPERVRLHLGVALSMLLELELDESAAHAADARDDARALGDRLLEAAALAVAATALTAGDPSDPAPADAGGAAFDALPDAEAMRRLPGLWMLAWANRALGRLDRAEAQLDRGTTLARASGRSPSLVLLRAEAATLLIELGRLAEAVQAGEEASERARLLGSPTLLVWALSTLSAARLATGDVRGAQAAADEAVEIGRPGDFQGAGQPDWALGNALVAGGHAAEGAEAIEAALDHLPPSDQPAAQADLVDARVAAGAATAADALAARARLNTGPFADARVRLAEGQALAAAGDKAAARAALTDAAERFERAGAERLRATAVRELRALGTRIHRPTGGDPSALTDREREIAELAAGGRTNREIAEELVLSVKTVEAHMRNIFGKLGISKRIELARGDVRFRE
jgi:ATP/maltotriose-dependent transcriptional regulator MalT